MPLPIVPIMGGLLRAAGSAAMRVGGGALLRRAGGGAAMAGLRLGGGALLRAAGGTAITSVIAGGRSDREGGEKRERKNCSPWPSRMHPKGKSPIPPPPSRAKSAGTRGMALLKASVSTAAGLALAGKAATFFAKSLNNSATNNLAMYNGQIAGLAAQKEVFNMQQNVRRGNSVAATTVALGDSLMRLEKKTQPFGNAYENTRNWILDKGAEGGGYFADALEATGITEAVRNYNSGFGKGQLNTDALDWMREAARGEYVDQALNQKPNETPGSRI
ncbi:MAG: hypothetical protein GXP26_05000 [Planctomycetes bacterium]|nr:hypothetical protein [Planctomycetota bacterium]